MTMTPTKRFMAKVVLDENGCLVWTAQKTPAGYGRFQARSKNWLAHRWIYEQLVGPIPEGLTLDHLCRNRSCVNVEHLEAVTLRENCSRGEKARRTHCPHGHEYTPANTIWNKRGDLRHRECRRCHNDRVRKAA
jgi:hypothetical protein